MTLTFKGGKTSACLSIDLSKKTYSIFNGLGNNEVCLATQKDLHELEINLIKGGFKRL